MEGCDFTNFLGESLFHLCRSHSMGVPCPTGSGLFCNIASVAVLDQGNLAQYVGFAFITASSRVRFQLRYFGESLSCLLSTSLVF